MTVTAWRCRRFRAGSPALGRARGRVSGRHTHRRREREQRRRGVVAGRTRLAFVSNRGDHAFIGIYTGEQTPIRWIAPVYLARRVAALVARRQAHRVRPPPRRGRPTGPGADAASRPVVAVGGRRHDGGRASVVDCARDAPRVVPGGDGANLQWAARDRIVFVSYHGGWPQLYSLPAAGGEPVLLTPASAAGGAGPAQPDGALARLLANTGPAADDVDRRHVLRVPVDRSAPEVLTPGAGLEWNPVITGDRGTSRSSARRRSGRRSRR